MLDVLRHTVCRDSNNHRRTELGRLREYSKIPDCSDYSRRDQAAIDLNFCHRYLFWLKTGWLHSPAFTRYIGNPSSKFQSRAKDFAIDRFAAKHSFVERKKEEAGTNGFPPLVRLSLWIMRTACMKSE